PGATLTAAKGKSAAGKADPKATKPTPAPPTPGKPPAAGDDDTLFRAVVIGDSDLLSDEVLPYVQGNGYFLLDALKWLQREETIAGEIISEADVPIAHTRKQDVAWFYSTIFVAPAVVLAAGWVATRSRRRARRRPPARPSQNQSPQPPKEAAA